MFNSYLCTFANYIVARASIPRNVGPLPHSRSTEGRPSTLNKNMNR
jgi:hypothetical protein